MSVLGFIFSTYCGMENIQVLVESAFFFSFYGSAPQKTDKTFRGSLMSVSLSICYSLFCSESIGPINYYLLHTYIELGDSITDV